MRSIVKALGISAVLAVVVGLAAPAQAAPIVYVSPSSVTVNTSITTDVTLDVLVSDPGVALGGYSFDLVWDVSVMDWINLAFDPDGNFSGLVDFSDATVPGTISAFIAGTPAGSNDGTTSPLRLASFTFTAAGGPGFQGQTNVDLLNVHLSNPLGEPEDVPGVSAQGGVVCFARLGDPQGDVVVPPCERSSVPEPMTLSLLAAGLATVAVRRRASKRS